jgi:ER lumen protein retaining receptor
MDFVLWLFSLGYLFQLVATAMLVLAVLKTRSIFGLSQDTQILFLVGQLARLIWIFDTRLYKYTLAQAELIANVLLSGYACYLCHKYSPTNILTTPKYLRVGPIVGLCAVLCFFFHPGDKSDYFFTIQMLVSFTIFTECAGLLPQFYLMVRRGEVEGMTKHYVMMLGIARFFRTLFWVSMYLKGESFLHLILADLLHTLVLVDFAYLYYKSMVSGKRLLLGR